MLPSQPFRDPSHGLATRISGSAVPRERVSGMGIAAQQTSAELICRGCGEKVVAAKQTTIGE